MSLRCLSIVFLVGGLWGSSYAQLTAAERKGLEDTLLVGNLRLADLRFERKPFTDPLRLKVIEECIDDPMGSADTMMAWHSSAGNGSMSALLVTALENGFGETPRALPPGPAVTIPPTSKIPVSIRPIVASLVSSLLRSDSEVRQATANLKPEEKRELIEGLPVWAVEEPKVKFEFVKNPPASQARILELLVKVDLPRIRAASIELTKAAEEVRKQLLDAKVAQAGLIRENIGGLPVEIGGTDHTEFTSSDARLTIDLGGNDVYKGRAGAGVAYSSVLIDLGGNDQFEVKDLSIGSAVLGIGIALIEGGNDTFRGKSLCFGAGLAGIGVMEKTWGNDIYMSTALTQGYGQFGVGICLDTKGDDKYDIHLYGQGAARTQGVGWLVDREGRDEYRAGGLSMNEPLFTGVSYSFAQGCGSGYREDTGGVSGGIGLLTDLQGDDAYLGDTYMQAASYWFAVGTLYDAGGNDTFSGYHYCQASSMHCCASFLFDLAGDDAYVTKYGASLAIGHDYGMALLLDRAGNDLYAARDSTPGVGVANGLGIFVDADGIDRYDGPPGQGNTARGTGSLGVFVDLGGGADKYRAGLQDGLAKAGSVWGASYDTETPPPSAGSETPTHQTPKPGSIPKPSEAELEKIYGLAVQWGVGSAQKDVVENVDKLIGIGVPAFEWMLEKHLGSATRLQLRAFNEVAKALGADAGSVIGPKALRGTIAEKRNLLSIAMEAKILDIGASLPAYLEEPQLRLAAAKAAGPLKAVAAIPTLTRLCLDPNKLLVRACIVSMLEIGDISSVGTAQALLNSSDLPTRMAALQLVAKFPDQARAAASGLIAETEEMSARLGIKLLSMTGSVSDLNQIATMLLDPRPGVRIEALQSLDGRCPDQYRVTMESLTKDPVAVVRAVAKGVIGKK